MMRRRNWRHPGQVYDNLWTYKNITDFNSQIKWNLNNSDK